MARSQMGQEVGARSARWQGRVGMTGGKRARWQLLGVVEQEGQMAGVVGQEPDGREPDGAGAVGQGGLDGWEEAMAGWVRAKWQLLGVVEQEGQMAGMVRQGADGREPDWEGAVGQGGPDGWEGAMAGWVRARWQLFGVVGVAWSRSSRWWAGMGQIKGKGQLEAR